jgi:hypothetical protein
MRIFALDPSTTAVGWCWAVDDEYLSSGVFHPQGDTAWDRIEAIEGWLIQTCVERIPHVLAFEVPAGDRGNRATNRKMGAVEFVIRRVAKATAAALLPVYPAQVKATGCSKDTPTAGTTLAGYTVSADEADAIGVYLWAWGMVKEREWTS